MFEVVLTLHAYIVAPKFANGLSAGLQVLSVIPIVQGQASRLIPVVGVILFSRFALCFEL